MIKNNCEIFLSIFLIIHYIRHAKQNWIKKVMVTLPWILHEHWWSGSPMLYPGFHPFPLFPASKIAELSGKILWWLSNDPRNCRNVWISSVLENPMFWVFCPLWNRWVISLWIPWKRLEKLGKSSMSTKLCPKLLQLQPKNE